MATSKSANTGRSTAARKTDGFSEAERAAMRERSREMKAEARRGKARQDGEADLLAKIAEMPEADRVMAQRIHEIVTANAPDLMPRTWYGSPAYAKDGAVVCFFQGAAKFDTRYATLGFNDSAKLDKGSMWPTSFALTKLTATAEKEIAALVKRAVRSSSSSPV